MSSTIALADKVTLRSNYTMRGNVALFLDLLAGVFASTGQSVKLSVIFPGQRDQPQCGQVGPEVTLALRVHICSNKSSTVPSAVKTHIHVRACSVGMQLYLLKYCTLIQMGGACTSLMYVHVFPT